MARILSLRSKLLFSTSAVVIASTLGLLVGVYWLSSRAIRELGDEEMEHIVSKTAQELDLWIDNRERDAVNLSELEPLVAACIDRRHAAAAQRTLDRIQRRSPFYENVFLADAAGKEFLDTAGGKSVGVELASVEGFRANVERAQQKEVWTGEVMKSPATGRAVVLLTAPVLAGNRLVGILGTPIELANFSDTFVSKYRIRDTGYLYMVDSSGTFLAHPNAAKILAQHISDFGFGREILTRSSGAMTYDYEGSAKVARFRRAQRKPWTIAAVVPARELLASVRTLECYLVLFGVMTLAAVVLAVWFLAEGISRTVRNAACGLETATRQFLEVSSQISSSSQLLSQAASEQAASVEETSASAEQISAITQQNNERSHKVAQLMNEAIPIVGTLNTSYHLDPA